MWVTTDYEKVAGKIEQDLKDAYTEPLELNAFNAYSSLFYHFSENNFPQPRYFVRIGTVRMMLSTSAELLSQEVEPIYKGDSILSFFAAKARYDIKHRNEANVSYPIEAYELYVNSLGRKTLTYPKAVKLIPAKGSKLYELNPEHWDAVPLMLTWLKEIQNLLGCMQRNIPDDAPHYFKIAKLNDDLKNMYAFEIAFNLNYQRQVPLRTF